MNDTIPPTAPPLPIRQSILSVWGDSGSKYFLIAGVSLVAMPWFGVAYLTFQHSSYGFEGPMDLLALFLLPVMVGIPGMFLTGILAITLKTTRPYAWSILIATVFATASLLAASNASSSIRTSAFEAVVSRADPLIQAIKKYEADKGYPPTHLNNIIPQYLPEIPWTGIGAYPKYTYALGDADTKYPWKLTVDVGYGVLNWDELLYLPSEQYPPKDFAVAHQKIGKWIYIME